MRGRRNLVAVLGVLALVASVVYVATNISGHIATSRNDPEGLFQDSRDAVYYPAKALFEDVNPYDPTPYFLAFPAVGQEFPLYSPAHIVIHAPLAAAARVATSPSAGATELGRSARLRSTTATMATTTSGHST